MLFRSIIGELLGNVFAGTMPFNVQNAIGNWLQLVGQAMLTYNAQQQYYQSGPGRYYDRANRDVTNPFIPSDSDVKKAQEMEDLKSQVADMKRQIEALSRAVENSQKG